jgi:hypothetical protein
MTVKKNIPFAWSEKMGSDIESLEKKHRRLEIALIMIMRRAQAQDSMLGAGET